ncbi:MAG: hypothetical protein C5S41_07670, partial [Candidatus Methanomarinus sp.]
SKENIGLPEIKEFKIIEHYIQIFLNHMTSVAIIAYTWKYNPFSKLLNNSVLL